MEYEACVRAILRRLGVSRIYQGHDYVVYGILLVLEDESRLEYITKSLYLDIAKRYGTTWMCVERNIRTVVDIAWRDSNDEILIEICGGEKGEKPKNSYFFEMLSAYVKKSCGSGINPDERSKDAKTPEDDCYCPKTGKWCMDKACLQRRIVELMDENAAAGRRKETVPGAASVIAERETAAAEGWNVDAAVEAEKTLEEGLE